MRVFIKKVFKSLLIILHSTLTIGALFAEVYYLPEDSNFIKTSSPVKNLTWNPTNTSFAYTDDNLILIRDSKTFILLKSIQVENIEKILYSKEGNIDSEVLLSLTSDGLLSTYSPSISINPIISINYKQTTTPSKTFSNEITALSFSQNSNYIVLADSENTITLCFELSFTNEILSSKALEHKNTIYFIDFSIVACSSKYFFGRC
jgi:WD40 repeat protein